jgi:cytochrome c-type biogenesis protein CcmH/NrfG
MTYDRGSIVSKDSLIVGAAGVFFGVLVGWIIGSQQTTGRQAAPVAAQSAAAPGPGSAPAPPPLDESRAATLKGVAQQNPSDADTRVALGNMYFDAGRYQDAAGWYEAALKIHPKDVNVSTDLGISYYYMNDADRALAQFDRSLALDPAHAKTLLNIGIVRAFGKQDMKGAAEVWQKILVVAPSSEEARAARQALDGLRSAHPDLGIPANPDAGRGTSPQTGAPPKGPGLSE